MGLLSQRVKRDKIKPGDHIYTWRAGIAYSHHGIYVGENKVVHFTPDPQDWSVCSSSSASFCCSTGLSFPCPNFPECGIRHLKNGVILSCLDCFLGKGSLYLFEYEVYSITLLVKVRGGTCTTAKSDPPETVIHRAMHLLQIGFGKFDTYQNNCEDFALYCKTGLIDKDGVGRSGQASSTIDAPVAALLFSPLMFFMPTGGAIVSAGMYYMTRYGSDIGVRTDVTKVRVEDLKRGRPPRLDKRNAIMLGRKNSAN